MNSLNERRQEALESVQDEFNKVFMAAESLRDYAARKSDAYLLGGMNELIQAMRTIHDLVSLKIALNGVAIENARKEVKSR